MVTSSNLRLVKCALGGAVLLGIATAAWGDTPGASGSAVAELKDALARAAASYDEVTASGVLTVTFPLAGTANAPQYIDYARNGAMRLVRLRGLDAAGMPRDEGERVLGTDGRSFYELARTPSGQFRVNFINTDGKSIDSDINFYAERYINSSCTIDVNEILGISGFHLETPASGVDAGHSTRKFSYQGHNSKGQSGAITGSMTVSPEEGGVLRAFESTLQPTGKSPITMRGQFEFGPASGGPVPPPTRSVISNLTGNEVEQTATFVVDQFSLTAPAASLFQLSAFRLGDVAQPVGTANPNWPSYLAFALGGMAIAATVALRVAAHRRASANPAR